jgi:hypothetical protein
MSIQKSSCRLDFSKTILMVLATFAFAVPATACDLIPGVSSNSAKAVVSTAWSAYAPFGDTDGQTSASDTRKELRFTLSNDSSLALSNRFGNISVKPSTGHQVVIIAIIHGTQDQVQIDSHQHQNNKRVEVETHILQPGGNAPRVDYEVQMPADASLTVECSSGEVRVEGIKGAVNVETETAPVTIRNISNGQNVHVQTVSGFVNLNGLKSTNVEVTSIGGDVELYSVNGSNVAVNTTSGKIRYTGNFLGGGQYKFRNHTGDMDILIPANASVEVNANSRKGTVDNDFPVDQAFRGTISDTSFSGIGAVKDTSKRGDSKVDLRSFSGKIRVKKQ